MYLHIGSNENIRIKEIIGIFDADTATVSAVTKKYLSDTQKKAGNVRFVSEKIPKSFVLYRDGRGKFCICFSQLSTSALAGRIEQPYNGHFEGYTE